MGTINRHSPGCQCCGAAPCDPCDPCCEDKALLCFDSVHYEDDRVSGDLDPIESEVDGNCAIVNYWARNEHATGSSSPDLTYATTGVDFINCPPFGLNPIANQSISDAWETIDVILGWDEGDCKYKVFVQVGLGLYSSAYGDCSFIEFGICQASSYADHDGGVTYINGVDISDWEPIDCDTPTLDITLTCTDPSTASFCGLPASINCTLTFSHS